MISEIINNLGGIVIIIILIIQIIQNTIIIFIQKKIDTKFNKTISDHNAKNDTKIHVSKALFDLEQQAINNTLSICKKVMREYIMIMVVIKSDDTDKSDILNNIQFVTHMDKLHKILNLNEWKNSINYVYMPKNIENIFSDIFNIYIKLYINIDNIFNQNGHKALYDNIKMMIDATDILYKQLNETIREHYNNIKTV